jgi:predicted dehydrogenase
MKKEERRLRIGVLGCGPIAQIAHFDACRKARNAELYAICDVADDLLAKMAAIHEPRVTYRSFDDMLADSQVEAVIVAVSDQFHVPLCLQAIAAGKHVLVEKPLGVTIEECEELRSRLQGVGRFSKPSHTAQLVFQIGNNRRFDPGIAFAQRFLREEVGQRMGFKAWYYDSTYRYTMTDNLQPIPVASKQARKPAGNPKADKRRYFMLTHGSHLVDSARFLGGDIVSVRARLLERFGAYTWFVSVDFADGSLGHLDLTIAVRGDFEEGFQIFGEYGSVKGLVYLPWYHKASHVECFSVKDGQFHRPLGEDAYTYKKQIEGFADSILHGSPQQGAGIEDGVAAMRAMVAIARSVESGASVRLADVTGGV